MVSIATTAVLGACESIISILGESVDTEKSLV